MNKKQLSRRKQWIIEQCQDINFGRITVRIRDGEPDLDRPWRTLRTVKLAGSENGPRPEMARDDVALCQEQTALLTTLERLPNETCVTIEIRHGLPFLVEIERDYQAA